MVLDLNVFCEIKSSLKSLYNSSILYKDLIKVESFHLKTVYLYFIAALCTERSYFQNGMVFAKKQNQDKTQNLHHIHSNIALLLLSLLLCLL